MVHACTVQKKSVVSAQSEAQHAKDSSDKVRGAPKSASGEGKRKGKEQREQRDADATSTLLCFLTLPTERGCGADIGSTDGVSR